jgi:hypothetical protein
MLAAATCGGCLTYRFHFAAFAARDLPCAAVLEADIKHSTPEHAQGPARPVSVRQFADNSAVGDGV